MVRSTLLVVVQVAFLAALSPIAAAQTPSPGVGARSASVPKPTVMDGNALDELARQQRIAVTGTLGFPPLPPITATSPRNSILYADRLPYGTPINSGGKIAATINSYWIPKALTGTNFQEKIYFQLPDGYDEFGPPHPMVIAYHGYGRSAASPAAESTVDEEANAHNWIYLSPTGLDDQLFGTPLCQQHIRAAITYMMSTYNVDPDQLYMVGFSAGSAIAANFAAQHRDPSGLMVAALGMVSATGDWTMEYNLGDALLQGWMLNFYNFNGPPSTHLFNYQAASTLYNDEGSYPPVASGVLLPLESMATNLGTVPTYITYDDQDTLPQVLLLCEQMESTLLSAGGTVIKTVVSGTALPGPPSVPAPHSWAVLDEVALFDFFSGRSVDRSPATFSAQQAVDATVSWATVVKDQVDQFSYCDATVNVPGNLITVSNLVNAAELHVDAGAAGLTGPLPVRVQVTNMGLNTTRLYLTGFADSPSYIKVPVVGSLITLVDSDPGSGPTGNGTLIVDVPSMTTFDGKIVNDPLWVTELTSSPSPVAIGSPITFNIDGPAGSPTSYIIVSLVEMLTPVYNFTMTAFPAPPAIIRIVPLDANGDITFGQTIPNDAFLAGLRFATQAVTTDGVGGFNSVSNLWGLYIAP